MKHPLKRIDYDALAVEEPDEFILTIRLNRPEAANAFNTAMGGAKIGEKLHNQVNRPRHSHEANTTRFIAAPRRGVAGAARTAPTSFAVGCSLV